MNKDEILNALKKHMADHEDDDFSASSALMHHLCNQAIRALVDQAERFNCGHVSTQLPTYLWAESLGTMIAVTADYYSNEHGHPREAFQEAFKAYCLEYLGQGIKNYVPFSEDQPKISKEFVKQIFAQMPDDEPKN